MLEKTPTRDEIVEIIGVPLHDVWVELCNTIDEKYDMERLWNNGGKAWTYEYKYRRGGKTLCSLYIKNNCIGFMIIFGKIEREKFETIRQTFSLGVQKIYDDATIYHDGKWVMYEPVDFSMFEDFMRLLEIKRKPNRKL